MHPLFRSFVFGASLTAEWIAQVAEAHRLDGRSHRVFGTLSYAAAT